MLLIDQQNVMFPLLDARLSDLAVMSMGAEIMEALSVQQIIEEFVAKKRKIALVYKK